MRRETLGLRMETSLFALVMLVLTATTLGFITGCTGGSSSPSVAVTAAASTVDGTDTTTLTATVNHDKNSAGVTWSASAGTLSSETTTSATFTAPAATNSSQTVTITATSVADTSKSNTATITVPAAPAVTSTSTSLAGSVGTPYSVQLEASGGISPYTWTLGTGTTLPACLTLKSIGVITTTSGQAPTASCAGTYSNLTFKVTDSGTPTPLSTTSSSLSITITAPTLTFPSSLPSGTVGTAYSASAAATGALGTTTYTLNGALPASGHLVFNTSTGAITGTPYAADAGTYTFTVSVMDQYGDTATSGTLSLKVNPAPAITFGPAPTATATAGTPYSSTLSASGGASALNYSITSGALPTGLTLTASTGVIAGTPTGNATTYNFTAQAADSYGDTPATQAYSITLNPGSGTHFAVALTSSTTITAGGTVSFTVTALDAYGNTATAYAGTVKFTSTDAQAVLPANSSLASGTGSFVATLKTAGSQTITATDTSAAATTGTSGSVTVNPGAYTQLVVTAPATVTPGAVFNFTATAEDAYGNTETTNTDSLNFTSSDNAAVLPGVKNLANGTGSFQATLNTVGTQTIKATDTTVSPNISGISGNITVSTALTISTGTTLPTGSVGTSYSQTLAASGGSPGYTWAVASGSSLPAGLNLSSAGVLSGTPAAAGAFSFTITVTDSASHTSSATFSLTIYGTLSFTTTNLSSATAGVAYAQTIGISGGVGPYTFTVSSGSLPAWATLNASTGKITGTPSSSQTGSTTFTVEVTDSDSHTAMQLFTLTVYSVSGADNSYLSGNYAFFATGWVDGPNDGSTYKAALAGSFVADGNGNIVSGTLDYNDGVGGVISNSSFAGTYALPSNNIGQMTIQVGGTTMTMAFAAGGISSGTSTSGRIIAFEDTTGITADGGTGATGGLRFSGEFSKQTAADFAAASLTGGYTFGAEGETCPLTVAACNSATDHGPLAVAGTMTLSGTGSVSNGTEDIGVGANDYAQTTFSGTYGTPNTATGRVTLTLGTATGLPTLDQDIWPTDLAIYIVSATKFYLVSTDSHENYALLVGQAQQQTVSSFSNSTLSGNSVFWWVQPSSSYVADWGTSSEVSQSTSEVGRLEATSSSGALSGNIEQNDEGTISSESLPGGVTYQVAANGRVTLNAGSGGGETVPVFYMVGANKAFGIETGNKAALITMEPQTSTTISSGSYVFGDPDVVPENGEGAGAGTAGSGNYSLTESTSDATGNLNWDGSVTGTYTIDSTGLITYADGSYGYVISSTKAIHLDTPSATDSSPSLSVLQQ